MNLETQTTVFKNYTARMQNVMLKKGNDYSNEDRLSNFKNTAAILGITPEQVCLTLIATKITRLSNLLMSGKEPDNESVEDNLIDLNNYSVLLHMIRLDNEPADKIRL